MKKLLSALWTAWLLAAGLPSQQQDHRSVEVVGRLFDGLGGAAAGVPVFVLADDDFDVAAAIRDPLTETGRDGSFRVRMPAKGDQQRFVLFGGRNYAVRRVPVRTDVERFDVGSICLAPGFVASGRLRTADGKPATGAKITGSDLLQAQIFMMSSQHQGMPEYVTRAIVDDDGVFRLPGMLRAAGKVRAELAGYFDTEARPVALGSPLDLTLRPSPPIRGRVIDKHGTPVADLQVQCGSVRTNTANDGTFVLQRTNAVANKLSTRIVVDGDIVNVEQPIGDPSEPVELALPAAAPIAAATLQIQARGHDGKPVASFDAYVHWYRNGIVALRPECTLIDRAARSRDHHAHTDRGTAVLAGPRIPTWLDAIIYVRADGHGWGRLETTSKALGTPLVVDLPRPVAVRGRVVDSDTGSGIAGMTVVPTYPPSARLRKLRRFGTPEAGPLEAGPDAVVTDADGRFEMPSLPPGQLVAFLADGDQTIGRAHPVDADQKDPETLLLTTGRRRPFRGTVRGADQPGLRIRRLQPGTPRRVANKYRRIGVSIGDDGKFDFGPVFPKPATIQVVLPLPARSFLHPHLNCGLWKPGPGADEPFACNLPPIATVHGKVDSEVPWSRLAVLAFPLDERDLYPMFAPACQLATVQPDRSYAMRLPAVEQRLVLVDLLTGIALSFRDFDPSKAGGATDWRIDPKAMRIELASTTSQSRVGCHLSYQPAPHHWPVPAKRLAAMPKLVTGMGTFARSGERLTLWFPDRQGRLQVRSDGELDIQLGLCKGDQIKIVLGDGAPRLGGR